MLRTKFALRIEPFTFAHHHQYELEPMFMDIDRKFESLTRIFNEYRDKGLYEYDDAPEHARDFRFDPVDFMIYMAEHEPLCILGCDSKIDTVNDNVIITLHILVPKQFL